MSEPILTDADLDQFEQLLHSRIGLQLERQKSLVKALRDTRYVMRRLGLGQIARVAVADKRTASLTITVSEHGSRYILQSLGESPE